MTDHFRRRSLHTFYLILIASAMYPQQRTDSINRPISLDEVSISTYHINDSILNSPVAISTITHAGLNSNNQSDISLVLNRVPGLYMQSANFTTNRISIRGIGARTPYGTNKIRAFYQNIPLTSGNSETTIEDLDLETIGQIEVIKGPLSSVYGAGLAGAIIISPNQTFPGDRLQTSTVFGSYGLLKQRISYSGRGIGSDVDISYHRLQSDGWRQNSSYDREGFTVATTLFRKQKSSLHLLANHTTLKAYIPSSIDRQTFDNNPRAAAPTWLAAKGFKQYTSALAGLSYSSTLAPGLTNATSVFINYRDNYEPRPFDVLEQFTLATGARTQFSGTFAKNRFSYIAGGEFFHDDYIGGTYENLYLQNNGKGSLEGGRLTESAQKRQHYNMFGQLRWQPGKSFEIQAGLNFNRAWFTLNNRFPAEQRSEESYDYDPIATPHLSLIWRYSPNSTAYVSVSRGFSMPSIDETLTSEGRINTSISPENGYNTEIGFKSYFAQKRIYTEVTAYRMKINDLLVARRVGDDQYVGVNAGHTSHMGIEIFAEANLRLGLLSFKPFLSGSAGRYRFDEYINDDENYSGNRLTGTPENKLNTGITISYRQNLYLFGEFQFTDGFPMNDANTAYSASYRVINIKGGYKLQIFERMTADLSAGINNLANEQYASMILVNATGFGGASPRYYYPGLPVNYFGSVALSYLF